MSKNEFLVWYSQLKILDDNSRRLGCFPCTFKPGPAKKSFGAFRRVYRRRAVLRLLDRISEKIASEGLSVWRRRRQARNPDDAIFSEIRTRSEWSSSLEAFLGNKMGEYLESK